MIGVGFSNFGWQDRLQAPFNRSIVPSNHGGSWLVILVYVGQSIAEVPRLGQPRLAPYGSLYAGTLFGLKCESHRLFVAGPARVQTPLNPGSTEP